MARAQQQQELEEREQQEIQLQQALFMVQQGLHAPKDQKNDFGGYNYRSAEAILKMVKPLLKEAGATIVLSDDIREIGDRVYIEATATFTVISGNWASTQALAREALNKKGMDDAQITGAASSYARKYALCGLLAIDDSRNDPDATNQHGKGPQDAPEPDQKALSLLEQQKSWDDFADVWRSLTQDQRNSIGRDRFEALKTKLKAS